MPSKTSSPDPLIEALTAYEYNDVTGAVSVNIAEALLAIAHAIDHLASVQEAACARHAQQGEVLMHLVSNDMKGHA